MNRPARRVDLLTREAKQKIEEAIAIRQHLPPVWRIRARRQQWEKYHELTLQAQVLIDRAAAVPITTGRR